MIILNRLAGLLAMGKTCPPNSLVLNRLLVNIAAVTMLIIAASSLFVLILCVLLWLGYLQLVTSGMSPENALLIAEGILILLFGVILWTILYYVRKMKYILSAPPSIGGQVSNVLHAFVDGVLTKPVKR